MRYYSSIAVDTALVDPVNSSTLEIPVTAIVGYPVNFPFTIVIDPDTLSEELCEIASYSGNVFTTTPTGRGFDSTTAVAHNVGAVVKHVISAADLREPQEHIAATTSVHGIADTSVLVVDADIAGMVTETGTQTLTNKTIDYNNNTITNLPVSGDASVSTVFMLGGM